MSEIEIRFQMNGVAHEDRTVTGTVMKYNSVGSHPNGYREIIKPGAFTFEPGLFLNRFHQRISPLARLGKQLTLTDSPTALELRAELPDTLTCTDVLKEIDAELLNGFSVEMRVKRDSWEKGARIIHAAHLEAIGLVDRPAYPAATLRWFASHGTAPPRAAKRKVRVW